MNSRVFVIVCAWAASAALILAASVFLMSFAKDAGSLIITVSVWLLCVITVLSVITEPKLKIKLLHSFKFFLFALGVWSFFLNST